LEFLWFGEIEKTFCNFAAREFEREKRENHEMGKEEFSAGSVWESSIHRREKGEDDV
jgi:hypothetical protein